MSGSEIIKLEIPSSPRFVGVARKVLEGVAANISLTEQQIGDLKLAVGEACTNAVKFSTTSACTVCIEYKLASGCLQITIKNKSKGFDPKCLNHAKPKAENLPVGGFGIYVIEQCVDELDIATKDGQTVLTMTKRLNAKAG
jgi:serine/threonine-protein kinase RsbW